MQDRERVRIGYTRRMVGASAKVEWKMPRDGPVPVAEDFPGCLAFHVPREALDDFEERIEYWDARNETVIVAEPPVSLYHEHGASRLARLVYLIAQQRGSPFDLAGIADLVVRDAGGRRQRTMSADQAVYLHPAQSWPRGEYVEHGTDDLPDVILEVDYSTDVRRRKLAIYEAWGFSEVWVEVPEARSRYRPKSRRSALTIHILEADRYLEAATSRAFPGWTAAEIHEALNEAAPSPRTVAVLRRVGGVLGKLGGTGPDDDPFLRLERAESRAEGRLEGRNEGRKETLVLAVLGVFTARGMAVSAAFRDRLEEVAATADASALTRIASECRDEDDFLDRAGE